MKYFFCLVPTFIAGNFVLDSGLWGPIALLMGLVFFHEAGHFLVAKWIGMPVSVFSLGFGPRLFGFRWNETDVRLSLLPFGGYVRLSGEGLRDSGTIDFEKFFTSKTICKPILFYSGGIIANVFIALAIFFWLDVSHSRIVARHLIPSPLVVLEVSPGTAAAQVGLQSKDRIHKFGNLTFPKNSNEDIVAYIQDHPGQTVPMVIERNGIKQEARAVLSNNGGKGVLGVIFESDSWFYDRRDVHIKDLTHGASFAVITSARLGFDILGSLGKIITNKASLHDISGPVAIIRASSRAARAGLVQFLLLSALISMNLAVMNALPIPFLDGGHVAIFLFERLYGKIIPVHIKERLFTAGFLVLASLTLVVIIMDIIKIFR
jgi:regulator of sigma E protease